MPLQALGYTKGDQPPVQASRRVKCTYPNCFRHFSTEKEMKTHKRKEPAHEYCHKCDIDCEDDSDLLIHMIESGKHIVCPMCGTEFKSNAGLETHITQNHQQSQNLKCIGCGEKFARAAGLMQHIERDECEVITQEVFERRLAEGAIAKDAWAAQLAPQIENVPRGQMSTFSDTDTTEQGGVSLLDQDILAEINVHSPRRDYLTPSLNMLSLRDQYPTLPDLVSPNQQRSMRDDGKSDLMSFSGVEVSGDKKSPKGAWSRSTPAGSSLFKPTNAPLRPADRNVDQGHRSSADKPTRSTDANAHVTTAPAPMIPAPILEPMNHFNDLTNKFECPGRKCGGSFGTIEAFNAHLNGDAHVGGRTVCPSCLSKFASTMALVAHCESPSKRCNIRNAANYNQILREITGGLIGAEGHHIDGSVRYVANDITKSGFW